MGPHNMKSDVDKQEMLMDVMYPRSSIGARPYGEFDDSLKMDC